MGKTYRSPRKISGQDESSYAYGEAVRLAHLLTRSKFDRKYYTKLVMKRQVRERDRTFFDDFRRVSHLFDEADLGLAYDYYVISILNFRDFQRDGRRVWDPYYDDLARTRPSSRRVQDRAKIRSLMSGMDPDDIVWYEHKDGKEFFWDPYY